jgi:hypothetical protein
LDLLSISLRRVGQCSQYAMEKKRRGAGVVFAARITLAHSEPDASRFDSDSASEQLCVTYSERTYATAAALGVENEYGRGDVFLAAPQPDGSSATPATSKTPARTTGSLYVGDRLASHEPKVYRNRRDGRELPRGSVSGVGRERSPSRRDYRLDTS